jgi:hypothetical protein
MHALNEIASSVPIIKQWSGEIDGLARKAHCIVGVIERRGGEVRCDPGPGQSLYIYISDRHCCWRGVLVVVEWSSKRERAEWRDRLASSDSELSDHTPRSIGRSVS